MDALPSFDTLLRHVADLRERNEQLGNEARPESDGLRFNRSLPIELTQYRKVIPTSERNPWLLNAGWMPLPNELYLSLQGRRGMTAEEAHS